MINIKRRAMNDQQKESRRQAILDATRQLFMASSYEQVNMIDVAQQVGLAKGTLYLYFKTKEELFLALLTQEFSHWFDQVAAELSAQPMPCPIAAFVTVIDGALKAHPALIRLIAIVHTVLENNIDFAAALAFKQMLRQRVEQLGPLIDSRLTFLQAGEGMQLLTYIQALAIGLQHMAEPSPMVQQVLNQPELALFRINFTEHFLIMLTLLLEGLAQRRPL